MVDTKATADCPQWRNPWRDAAALKTPTLQRNTATGKTIHWHWTGVAGPGFIYGILGYR